MMMSIEPQASFMLAMSCSMSLSLATSHGKMTVAPRLVAKGRTRRSSA